MSSSVAIVSRQRTGETSASASSAAGSVNGAAVAQLMTGNRGSSKMTVPSASRNGATAPCICGE